MTKVFHQELSSAHPFAELLGFHISKIEAGYSECTIDVKQKLFNPHNVLHGGVLSAMASTGMGGALYPLLDQKELCVAVETTIRYFKPVATGVVLCKTRVINKGKTTAAMETEIWNEERLVAKASGTFAIIRIDEK